jgi:hypothetical protein
MSNNRLKKIVPAGLLSLGLAVTPLAAADKKDETKPIQKTTPAPAAAAPGMVVVKDPDSGTLRAPTAEEWQAMQAGAAAKPLLLNSVAGSPTLAGPGGGVGLVLDDSTHVFAVAQKTADGKVAVGEVTGAAAAKAAGSQTGVKPAAPTAKKGAALDEK